MCSQCTKAPVQSYEKLAPLALGNIFSGHCMKNIASFCFPQLRMLGCTVVPDGLLGSSNNFSPKGCWALLSSSRHRARYTFGERADSWCVSKFVWPDWHPLKEEKQPTDTIAKCTDQQRNWKCIFGTDNIGNMHAIIRGTNFTH